MKHKHHDVLIAIAEGKEVEGFHAGKWHPITFDYTPLSDPSHNWRVKPEPEAEWKQKLRQAAREGKRVEYRNPLSGWTKCFVVADPNEWKFFDSEESDYCIVPKKVTRWLWAYKYAGWTIYSHFLTESEAALQFRAGEYRKIESSVQEFEE